MERWTKIIHYKQRFKKRKKALSLKTVFLNIFFKTREININTIINPRLATI